MVLLFVTRPRYSHGTMVQFAPVPRGPDLIGAVEFIEPLPLTQFSSRGKRL